MSARTPPAESFQYLVAAEAEARNRKVQRAAKRTIPLRMPEHREPVDTPLTRPNIPLSSRLSACFLSREVSIYGLDAIAMGMQSAVLCSDDQASRACGRPVVDGDGFISSP
jgi:hypothetical protein